MQGLGKKGWILSFFSLSLPVTQPLPHTKCKRSYKKLGCFEADSKLFDELLINDRDKRSSKNDGHSLNWRQWEASIHRCGHFM